MTVDIIPNLHVLRYDPNKSVGAKIVTQDVNYAGGNTIRSVSKSFVRLIQDMNKRILPTMPREGLGVTINGTFVEVAIGYAIINGRWVEVDALEQIDASSFLDGDYYVILQTSDLTDGDNRDPELENASVVILSTIGYTASASEIVLAKIHITSGSPVILENYNVISNQFRVGLLAPPTSPDGSSYSQIILAAGSVELQDVAVVDKSGMEFISRLRLRDQSVSSQETSLRNVNGEIQVRNEGSLDDSFMPFAASQFSVGNTVVVSSLKELQNIVSLNTHPIPIGSDSMVSVDAVQTLTNKEFTTPTVSLLKLKDTSGDNTYNFVPSELTADRQVIFPLLTSDDTVVFANHVQTLTNKELTSPIVTGMKIQDNGTHYYTMTTSNLSNDVSVQLPQLNASDTFVFSSHTQTLTNKTLDSSYLVTPNLKDLSGDNIYTIQPSELTSDVTVKFPVFSGTETVSFVELAETLKNKTLDVSTTVIKDITNNKSLSFDLSPIASSSSATLIIPTNGTVVLLNAVQTLSNKTLVTPTVTNFTNAQHDHSNATNGGQIAHADLNGITPNDHHSQQHDISSSDHTGTLIIAKGGTGKTTFSPKSVLFGNGTGSIAESNVPGSTQILIGQPSGNPIFRSVSGAITMDESGVTTLNSSKFFIESETRQQIPITSISSVQSSATSNTYGSSFQLLPSSVIQLFGTKHLRVHSFTSNWTLKIEYIGSGETFGLPLTSKAFLLMKWGSDPSVSDVVAETSISGISFAPGQTNSVTVTIADVINAISDQGLDGQSLYIRLAVQNPVALTGGNVKASISAGGSLNVARLFGVVQL